MQINMSAEPKIKKPKIKKPRITDDTSKLLN